jgi:hypothetical protein
VVTPLHAIPSAAPRGPQQRPQEKPGTRQALLDTLANLDQARGAIAQALQQPVIDTCGVFIQRAGTQLGFARNNLIRANTCLQAPADMRAHMNFRRVTEPPPQRF